MTTYYTGTVLYFIFYNLSNLLSCKCSTFIIIFDASKKVYILFFDFTSTFFICWILIANKISEIPNVAIPKY